MNYPQCLGWHIHLMPTYTQNEEWFRALPKHIQRRFWLIAERFPKVVAAEYLRDNHGTVPPSKRYNLVRGEVYSNCIKFQFPDGDRSVTLRGNPADWACVGYVDTPDRRYIRCSNEMRRLDSKLRKLRMQLIQDPENGFKTLPEPQLFQLKLTVAEDIAGWLQKVKA